MEYALIKNGVIDNVILADDTFIEAHGDMLAEGGEWVALIEGETFEGQRPGPGWAWNERAQRFERGDA